MTATPDAREKMRAAWTPERRAAQAERVRMNKPYRNQIGVPLSESAKQALRVKQAAFWTAERRREWSRRQTEFWTLERRRAMSAMRLQMRPTEAI